jgi:hypothetical protein
MSNSTRKVARSKTSARTRLVPATRATLDDFMTYEPAPLPDLALAREIESAPSEELVPLSAVFECSRAAQDRGFRRGFSLGLAVGGAVALLTYAVTFATSVLP